MQGGPTLLPLLPPPPQSLKVKNVRKKDIQIESNCTAFDLQTGAKFTTLCLSLFEFAIHLIVVATPLQVYGDIATAGVNGLSPLPGGFAV